MTLHGQGGRPTLHGTDTTTAGLTASESEHIITREDARQLWRPLPGHDTTYTFVSRHDSITGVIFLHTERVDNTLGAQSVESGFARADGMVGTARVTYDREGHLTYDAIWTDSTARPVRHHLAASANKILLHEDLALDTLPLPAVDSVLVPSRGDWAIAEYAMDELLAPAIRALPPDTVPHILRVFRPTPRRWDTLRISVHAVQLRAGRALVAKVFTVGDRDPRLLVFAVDGTLLLALDPRVDGTRRGPSEVSARGRELQAIMDATKQ